MQVNKSKKYAYILVFLSIHGRYAVFFLRYLIYLHNYLSMFVLNHYIYIISFLRESESAGKLFQ